MWLIPLLAVAVGAWLAWDTLSKRGPTITVSFVSAEGLQAGQSQLKFKDIVLGTVKSLDLTPDHTRVLVTVETTRNAEPLLTDATIFWVVKPRLFAGNLEGLSTLASGSYLGMMPARTAGKRQLEFTGREDPPVLETEVPGRTFELKASRVGSVSVGSPIFFRDLDVGTVLGWDIGDMVESVTIHAFIRAPYDSYVHDESRFWDASGVSVKLAATGIDVQFESLRAMLLGGVAFDTPATAKATPASAEKHEFPLFADRELAKAASYTRTIPLISYFTGSIKGLGAGSEVTMHGLVVGHVVNVGLTYDAAKASIVAPVEYEIQPERVVGVGRQEYKSPREAVDAAIKQGLRATLQSSSIITGQQAVTLDFVPDAPPAALAMEGSNFIVPATEGGGLAGLEASATDLMNKVNSIPFDQIGRSVNSILSTANGALHDEETRKALADLANMVASAKALVGHLDTSLTPAAKQLPELVASLQKTVTNASQLVQSLNAGYGDNTKVNRDLARLLVQANEAMNAIRALADFLSRDPTALIRGRTEGSTK